MNRLAYILASAACLGGLGAPSIAKSEDARKVRIINEASLAIVELYAPQEPDGALGEDVLFDEPPIQPGQTRTIIVGDETEECLLSIYILFANGEAGQADNVDVCKVETLYPK